MSLQKLLQDSLSTLVSHAYAEPPSAGARMADDTDKTILSYLAEEEEDHTDVSIFRVPHYMRAQFEQDFTPLELFVGLYCHSSLKLADDMDLDFTKLAIAREFCRGPLLDSPPASSSPAYRPIRREAWTELEAYFDNGIMTTARRMYDRLKHVDAAVMERQTSVVILDALFIVVHLRYAYSFDDCWNFDFQQVIESHSFNSQRYPLLRDLLVLENQVPMCLLEHVLKYIHERVMNRRGDSPDIMLYNLLHWFVMHVYPFNHGVKLDESLDRLGQHLETFHKHGIGSFLKSRNLLECAYIGICGPNILPPIEKARFCVHFRTCFKRGSVGPGVPSTNRFRIPSATSLRRVGITVKVRKDSVTMNSIKFERQRHKYALLVPKLIVSDYTASIFKNLALYEQITDTGYETRGDLRTYMYLMSSLLDNVHDVRLLVNCGVIVNQLGSSEAVCQQWNQMCDGLFIPASPPHYWRDLQDRISQLEKSKSNRWFAEIEEQNFSSFIVFISFLAFSIIFIATIVQAVFSVLSYL